MERKFNVMLWCGCGYGLDTFTVNAVCEEHALDLVVVSLIENKESDYFMTEREMEEARAAGNVYELNEDEIEGWLYYDATMEGAPYPVWIRTENMKIQAA